MATLFQIPGNIKQQYLPFVLNPESPLNLNANSSTEIKGEGAQFFSFRNKDIEKYKAGFGKLQICPSSLTNMKFGNYIDQDISYKLLYNSSLSKTKKPDTAKQIELNDIFNMLPGIQIREFLPDTKLDQCLNFFGGMLDAVKELISENTDGDKTKTESNEDKEKRLAYTFKKISAIFWHAFDYMTGKAEPSNLYVDKKGNYRFAKFNGNRNNIYFGDKLNNYILNFPYMLYYRLQSCVTTNVYELPCKTGDDIMYQSDGKPGWTGGTNTFGLANTFLGKIPVIGDILKNILGNVQINFMPWWDAQKGAATPPKDIEIQFDLFNDTAEAAMMNFIFVNTIIPNNRWIQYNMFQHSPCLYDVKIEGYDRLFACAGSFSVKAVGTLRTPPYNWVQKLCYKYGNHDDTKSEGGQVSRWELFQTIRLNNLIKIPDVYHVSMSFSSLLPNNFNNYLFTYSQNTKMETEYATGNIYEESAILTLGKAVTTDFVSEMVDFIKDKDGALTKAIKKADEDDAKKYDNVK